METYKKARLGRTLTVHLLCLLMTLHETSESFSLDHCRFMQVHFLFVVYAEWKVPQIARLIQKQMGYLILLSFYFEELGGRAMLLTSVAQ